MRKQDPQTGKILPLIAKEEIPKIEKMVVELHEQGKSTRQLAGILMDKYDCNIHLANSLVKSSLLTVGKN